MKYYGIDTNEISIVVQGAIDPVSTPKCLKSLRKHLKGAEIILSTWEGTDVSGLSYDRVVYSKDPGGIMDRRGWINNLNRQLVSTQNGLKLIERKYAMKLRNDLVFQSHEFLKYYTMFPKRNPEYTMFKERILVCSYFFKRYAGVLFHMTMPTPFHISDWLMFGLTDDIAKLFDIDIPEEPAFTNWFVQNKVNTLKPNLLGTTLKYTPEQYILYSSVSKNMGYKGFLHMLDFNSENIDFSEKFIANNCIILEPQQFKFYLDKNGDFAPYKAWTRGILSEYKIEYATWEALYRYDIFVGEYKKHCDLAYQIPHKVKKTITRYLRLNKFLARSAI